MVSNVFPPVFPHILMMTGQRLDAEAERHDECFLSHLDDLNAYIFFFKPSERFTWPSLNLLQGREATLNKLMLILC